MILHLATFAWNSDVTDADVSDLTRALLQMAADIPELISYECGPSLRLRAGGADFGVVAVVSDVGALSAYLDSAAHAAVYECYLGRMIASRMAVQLPLDGAFTLGAGSDS